MPIDYKTRTTIPRGRERLDEVAAILLAGIVRMTAAERGGGRSERECNDLGESSLDFPAYPSMCPTCPEKQGEPM